MANNIFGWKNYAEGATLNTSTPMQTAWPIANAVTRRLAQAAKTKPSARRQASLTLDLGSGYSTKAARFLTLTDHALGTRGRIRVQGSNTATLGDPTKLFDFLSTTTDGRTYPNTLPSEITFSRASGGMCWRGGELFGSEFVETSAMALDTSATTWTVRKGGKWQTGDLVYVLPQDGTANIVLTATVSSYAGAILTLTSITAGSDTTTTKTAWKIVYRGPRLDSHPVTAKRRGFLVEGSATNLRTYSQQFTNAVYTESGATSFDNMVTAPDGTTTASLLLEDGSNGPHTQADDVTITADTVDGTSRWFKANGRHQVQLTWGDTTGTDTISAVFNLRTRTKPAASTTGSASSANAFITRARNGWLRCTVVGKINASDTTGRTTVSLYNGGTSYVGEPGKGVAMWQAQVEAGSKPTSDIPTTTVAATRSADLATVEGEDFTSFFKQGPGTILVSASSHSAGVTNAHAFAISDGTFNNRILVANELGTLSSRVTLSGVERATLNPTTATNGVVFRAATAWAGNDFATSADGRSSATDNSGSLPTVDRMYIGANATGSGAFAEGHIQELAYFARRLANAQLEAWSRPGATIDTDFTACTVDLPVEYTFSRASGGGYVDSLGRLQGQYPAITTPIVPQTTKEERVRNGGFDTDTLWTKGTGWTIGSGVATKAAGSASSLTQTIPTIPGQVYKVRVEVTAWTAGTLAIDAGGTDLQIGIAATGTYSKTFTASATTTTINFEADDTADLSIDNVSITLDQGLRVNLGAGQDVRVGQLMRWDPQDGTANTYMIGAVVSYDSGSGEAIIDVIEAAAPELISNGHFTSATTDWTAQNSATLAAVSGELEVTWGATNSQAAQSETVTSGQVFRFEGEHRVGTATQAAILLQGATALFAATSTAATGQRVTTQVTSDSSTLQVWLRVNSGSAGQTCYFDNVSLKRAHTDWIVALAGPRFTHDTAGTALGLMQEPAATNLLLNSTTLSTQGVTVTAVEHTLSFYGTGTVTLSGVATAGPLVGTGDGERVSLTFTPTAGTLTLTVSGDVEHAQLETGSAATSWIWTGSVSRSRSADVCTIEGDEFTARYRQDAGTLYWEAASAVSDATFKRVAEIGISGATTNRYIAGFTTNPRFLAVSGGSNVADINALGVSPLETSRNAAAFQVNDFALSSNGGAAQTDTSGAIPAVTLTAMFVGADSIGSNSLTGTISRLIYKPERDPDADLVAMTTSGADLDDYTLPGTLADAYAGIYDSGWLDAWQTGQTLPKLEAVFSADQTYRYWRVDQLDYAGPASDPGTTDDAVTLEWPYLGLWKGWQPVSKNRSYGSSKEPVSQTQVQLSLSGAEEFERRTGYDAWNVLFKYLTNADLAVARAIMKYADIDTPIYFIPDPDATGADRDEAMLCRLERLSPIEEAFVGAGATAFRIKQWIA